MYLILDNSDTIRNITDRVLYVKTLKNGSIIVTTPEEGVAVHSDSGDSFWRLKSGSPGDELFHVVEVQTLPDGVQTDVWKYIGGEVVVSKKTVKETQIAALRSKLSTTDYKIIKCSEYQLAGQKALPYDVASLHAERQALRDEINRLEAMP